MRELRIQHQGKPYRALYAFDPLRVGILLIGGDKTGNERWYEEHIPIADRLYDEHVDQIKRERKTPDKWIRLIYGWYFYGEEFQRTAGKNEPRVARSCAAEV